MRCADAALACCEGSVQAHKKKKWHAHNLLGRIHYAFGDEAQGDKHFDLAKQLGCGEKGQREWRRRALEGRPDDMSGESQSKDSLDQEVPF